MPQKLQAAKLSGLKKTAAIPTLENIKKKLEEKEEVKEEKEEVEVREAFSTEALKAAWNEFSLKLKEEGRDFDYTAINQEIVIVEKEKVQITLANKSQERAIEGLRQDLLGHLRKKLRNSFIDLAIEFQKIDETQLRYTNKEKFDYLAQKYPLLQELKKRLDLDPDF